MVQMPLTITLDHHQLVASSKKLKLSHKHAQLVPKNLQKITTIGELKLMDGQLQLIAEKNAQLTTNIQELVLPMPTSQVAKKPHER